MPSELQDLQTLQTRVDSAFRADDLPALRSALGDLAVALFDRRDYDGAREAAQRELSVARDLQDHYMTWNIQRFLSDVLRIQGERILAEDLEFRAHAGQRFWEIEQEQVERQGASRTPPSRETSLPELARRDPRSIAAELVQARREGDLFGEWVACLQLAKQANDQGRRLAGYFFNEAAYEAGLKLQDAKLQFLSLEMLSEQSRMFGDMLIANVFTDRAQRFIRALKPVPPQPPRAARKRRAPFKERLGFAPHVRELIRRGWRVRQIFLPGDPGYTQAARTASEQERLRQSGSLQIGGTQFHVDGLTIEKRFPEREDLPGPIVTLERDDGKPPEK